ncbi:MAG: phosphoglycerate kinase [Humidesulfovibrio sp.]|nr:phosphoglycerate kinase [Humidesulfovibrio sp.]
MRSLDQLDITGKKLLIRVDYNVPLDGEVINDDIRIRASLPTLRYALDHGAAIILCAHVGNPKGQRVPELSLKPMAARLSELLGLPVPLAPDCVGPEAERLAAALKPGEVLMLENLRYHAEEQGKTPEARGDFGKRLAALADIYVNDAFGVAHRPNASVVDVPRQSRQCCAGFLLRKEWDYLSTAMTNPKRPYVAISGGAKVSTKLGIIQHLLPIVDHLVIGGAMANTFLLAQGYYVGASLVEEHMVDTAKVILDEAGRMGAKLHLPVDFLWGMDHKQAAASGICDAHNVPEGAMLLDIGPKTLLAFGELLHTAKTVVWNGPMGLFENPAFAKGSIGLCKLIANLSALTIVGGGDTDSLVHEARQESKMSFISTGGGSFLEFLEGKELPAFTALKECGA